MHGHGSCSEGSGERLALNFTIGAGTGVGLQPRHITCAFSRRGVRILLGKGSRAILSCVKVRPCFGHAFEQAQPIGIEAGLADFRDVDCLAHHAHGLGKFDPLSNQQANGPCPQRDLLILRTRRSRQKQMPLLLLPDKPVVLPGKHAVRGGKGR